MPRPLFPYLPNEDEAQVAWLVAGRRNSLNAGQSNLPGGETASVEERRMQHYAACLAEIAVSRVLNLCWTGCGKGAAGLRDVGGEWEVRSITDWNRGLLHRPKDDPTAPFVLVHVEMETRLCTIIGWAEGSTIRRHGRQIGQGTDKPAWVLPSDMLTSFIAR